MNTEPVNTKPLERNIVSILQEDAAKIEAWIRELNQAQHIVDDVCNLQDGALEAFDAETQRMKHANPDRDTEAILQAARDAGYPNAVSTSELISRHWEATSESYRQSQPSNNDLYPY